METTLFLKYEPHHSIPFKDITTNRSIIKNLFNLPPGIVTAIEVTTIEFYTLSVEKIDVSSTFTGVLSQFYRLMKDLTTKMVERGYADNEIIEIVVAILPFV